MRACMHACILLYIRTFVHSYIHTYIHIYIYVYLCVYVYIYNYVCVLVDQQVHACPILYHMITLQCQILVFLWCLGACLHFFVFCWIFLFFHVFSISGDQGQHQRLALRCDGRSRCSSSCCHVGLSCCQVVLQGAAHV